MVYEPVESLLRLFTTIFSRIGFDVVPYQKAFTTPEEVKQAEPNILVLGYLNGYEASDIQIIVKLRADPITHTLPILISTTLLEIMQKLLEPYQFEYLFFISKPFDYQSLVDCIHTILTPESPELVTATIS